MQCRKLNFALERSQLTWINGICYAAKSYSFIIGADGTVYKCTVELKKDINRIGKINKNGIMSIDKDKFAYWVMRTPFKGGYEKCSCCYFQPSCMSVCCPINRFNDSGVHQCSSLKGYVDEYMRLCAQCDQNVEEVTFGG